MARFLAIDWDHNQLHVVSATVRHGAVHIDKAAVWQEEQSPNLAQAADQGRVLRQRLKEGGFGSAPLLVCIGRERVILKDVRYPPVPANEEAAIVRFQVAKEVTEPADEIVVDYTPVGDAAAGGDRRALALVLRTEWLQAYREISKAAGLKLAAITPRPFGSSCCLRRLAGTTVLTPAPDPVDAAVAVLTVAQHWAEFCIVRGETMLLSRALAVGPGLAGEVRRNLAVYAGQSPQQPVAAIYVAGSSEHGELREKLQGSASVPVYSFDPFAGAERPDLPADRRGAFAAAVGLLQLQADQRPLPIDFAHPKQPRPARDPNQKRLLVAATAAAVLLVILASIGFAQLHARGQELQALALEKRELDTQLVIIDEEAKRIKALEDWTNGAVVWLDELYDLTDRFPDINSLRLTQFTAVQQAATAKSKSIAKLSLKGIASDDYQPVDKLISRYAEDAHYAGVSPKHIVRNTGVERTRFSQQFDFHMELEHILPSRYVRRLPDPPPDSGSRRERSRRGAGPAAGNGADALQEGQP